MNATFRRVYINVSEADIKAATVIERFIAGYDGDDLLHDIELTFPGASYRSFFLAYRRAQNLIGTTPEGCA